MIQRVDSPVRSFGGLAALAYLMRENSPVHSFGDLGDSNPGANCDYGVLRTINFEGHNIQICKQHFWDALAQARYNYIESNGLWQSQGCIRDGIYTWPAVDASEYSGAAPASVVAAAKATYPGDHGTIYVFGSHRDDSCIAEPTPAPFGPWGGLNPENWAEATATGAGGSSSSSSPPVPPAASGSGSQNVPAAAPDQGAPAQYAPAPESAVPPAAGPTGGGFLQTVENTLGEKIGGVFPVWGAVAIAVVGGALLFGGRH